MDASIELLIVRIVADSFDAGLRGHLPRDTKGHIVDLIICSLCLLLDGIPIRTPLCLSFDIDRRCLPRLPPDLILRVGRIVVEGGSAPFPLSTFVGDRPLILCVGEVDEDYRLVLTRIRRERSRTCRD